MNRRTFNLAVPALLAGAGRAMAQPAGWVALFNGRGFDGFDPVGNANWRIEDGALVADRGNGFLVTRANYANFEFRTEVWVDTSTNSGIFIRATNPTTISAANA